MSIMDEPSQRSWFFICRPGVKVNDVVEALRALPVHGRCKIVNPPADLFLTFNFEKLRDAKPLYQAIHACLRQFGQPFVTTDKLFYKTLGSFVIENANRFYYKAQFQKQYPHRLFKNVCVCYRGKGDQHFFLESTGAMVKMNCTENVERGIDYVWAQTILPELKSASRMVRGISQ